MEIRCKKGDCTYNTGCSCDARMIEVQRSGQACGSYQKDEIKENLMIENGNIFEIAEELVARNVKDVPLACRARSCLYNKADRCCANGITVIDTEINNKQDAGCATFIEK